MTNAGGRRFSKRVMELVVLNIVQRLFVLYSLHTFESLSMKVTVILNNYSG